MEDLFTSLYTTLFGGMIGESLNDYLLGFASPNQDTNMYQSIGLLMLVVSAALAAVFYYAINHPRLNSFGGWAAFWVGCGIASFLVGWGWLLKDRAQGRMYYPDPGTGESTPLPISDLSIMGFGAATALLALVAFFLISLAIKHWSRNCSHAPF